MLDFEKSLCNKKICGCGSIIKKCNMRKHFDSKKHELWVQDRAFREEFERLGREIEEEREGIITHTLNIVPAQYH